ncbi:MAG: GAF domain-containing sensor histidine kinase [Ardenticatenaceae bacterium]|nr:GAF domain-containing sensor histidine kinase [Ardenticatenaceae bacterium]MCB8989080.1 GAF domain-containing sensor histidine kinase [Ardenticatenaceae bacterium]
MVKGIAKLITKETTRQQWALIGFFLLAFFVQGAAFYLVASFLLNQPVRDWMPWFIIASLVLLFIAIVVLSLAANSDKRITQATQQFFTKEVGYLEMANKRAQRLQAMASTLRATLSFERVVEEALDICSMELEEMGTPRQSLVAAVYLFRGQVLYPVATRLFIGNDMERVIPGRAGIVGQALSEAEPAVTHDPRNDPELSKFVAFQNCVTAVCIPLRAGFQIFGAMVFGSGTAVELTEGHFELFNAVGDQAVIALQNAQLYQQLTAEKQRLIEADEEARKELARDLHDGPTQSIAAIAMRINFIRSLISRNPQQSLSELEKVEELAKRTVKEIRGMLFTLRPLVLETQGLAAAIETVMSRIREADGLNMRLVGGENGDLLSEQAQSVVFSIVEEAVGNARKYSQAKLIEVRLWKEDNLFVARIQDDGIGFDTEEVNRDYSSRGSLGMVNMRERAERIDGSLRVESVPGKGTAVTLVVPLAKHGSLIAAR